MNTRRELFIGFGLMSMVVVSCEKTMYMDLPVNEKKIVVNGIMAPDYGLWLNLSQSISTPEASVTSYLPITNATVDYYENNEMITSISNYSSGDYYETDFKPRANQEYKLIVNAPGLAPASVSATIPDPVEIVNFDTTTILRNVFRYYQPIHYEFDFFVNFSIEDPGTVANFYMLGVYYLEEDGYQPVEAETEDMTMNIYIKDGINVLAWNDENFNGEKRDFSVSFSLVQPAGYETRILVTLYSIEENYFKYLKSYSQNFTVLNEDALLFEGVQVFSNIVGGYGILAAVSSSSRSFYYIF